MFYNGRSSQPSTSQLMPVPDNTDPLNISLGNPYLESYFSHNMRAMFRYTNKKTFTSVNARINGSVVQDAITSAQWYDKSGTQYSIPVNGPGTGSANAMIMVNTPIAKSNFSISSFSNVRPIKEIEGTLVSVEEFRERADKFIKMKYANSNN